MIESLEKLSPDELIAAAEAGEISMLAAARELERRMRDAVPSVMREPVVEEAE